MKMNNTNQLEEMKVKGMNKVGDIGIKIYELLDQIKLLKHLNHHDMKMAESKGEREVVETKYRFVRDIKEIWSEIVDLEDQRHKTIEEYDLASTVQNIYFTNSTEVYEGIKNEYQELTKKLAAMPDKK